MVGQESDHITLMLKNGKEKRNTVCGFLVPAYACMPGMRRME